MVTAKQRAPDLHGVCMLSRVWFSVTPRTVAQAPLSVEFSRQEYWSGLPLPPPGDLHDPGIKPTSLVSPMQADSSPTSFTNWPSLDKGIRKKSILWFLEQRVWIPLTQKLVSWIGMLLKAKAQNLCQTLKNQYWVISKPLLEAKKIILNECHTLDETLELEIQCYNLDVRSRV